MSIGIHKGIEDGLDPEIHIVDMEGGPIQDAAKISEISASLSPKYKRKVTVSAAYMQILWIICNIALKNNDSIAIEIDVDNMSDKDRERYFRELSADTPSAKYQRELLDKNGIFQESAEKVNMIEKIASKKLTDDELESLYSFDIDSTSGLLTNGMYVYAMTFALLHEFSHHSLDQDFSKEATLDEEVAADQSAFGSMYSDLKGEQKYTAMYGVICSLVSLLFINPELIDDGIHPKPVERIFEYYEFIKDENTKYAGLLCHLLYAWAVYTRDNDMPKLDRPYDELIYLMKDHLLKIEEKK